MTADEHLCYPLHVIDDRALPPGYDGPVFLWDIDKTYLATRFSQPKYMARIPLEFAVDKQAIPGMPEVLKGLRRGTSPVYACAPLYFVSASPPQLRAVITHKMLLDGVDYDGITFKDWAKTLRQLRPGRLKEQVGFKVCALLEGRRRRLYATEYLFGDDYEKDAIAYSLYARMLSGDLQGKGADDALAAAGVKDYDRACALRMRDSMPAAIGSVGKIFIHLEKGTNPSEFDSFGPRVMATRNAFQLAAALAQLGLVDVRTVRQCTLAMRGSAVFGRLDFDDLLADAVHRGLVTAEVARELVG